ncbi:MAG: hypothetical protein WC538_22220 [Thermoanaerobaculia bacterium]
MTSTEKSFIFDGVMHPLLESEDSAPIHALDDRMILRFPPPIEKIGSIIVADEWKMRPELAELISIGHSTTLELWQLRDGIVRLANAGARFVVPMYTGQSFWRKELGIFGDEFEFLKDIRIYAIDEPTNWVMPRALNRRVALDGTQPLLDSISQLTRK